MNKKDTSTSSRHPRWNKYWKEVQLEDSNSESDEQMGAEGRTTMATYNDYSEVEETHRSH
jgi:hypothetical protein